MDSDRVQAWLRRIEAAKTDRELDQVRDALDLLRVQRTQTESTIFKRALLRARWRIDRQPKSGG